MIKKYEETFSINEKGETTGEQFLGKFTVKTRLSFRDALQRDSVRRNLLGDRPQAADVRANSIADTFSELAVRVVDAPSWWTNSDNGLELSDDNVVAAVYIGAMQATKTAAQKEIEQAEANKKELSKGE